MQPARPVIAGQCQGLVVMRRTLIGAPALLQRPGHRQMPLPARRRSLDRHGIAAQRLGLAAQPAQRMAAFERCVEIARLAAQHGGKAGRRLIISAQPRPGAGQLQRRHRERRIGGQGLGQRRLGLGPAPLVAERIAKVEMQLRRRAGQCQGGLISGNGGTMIAASAMRQGLFGQSLPLDLRWSGHGRCVDYPHRARNRDQPMAIIAPCRVSPGRHSAAMAGATSAGLGSTAWSSPG